MVIIQVSKAGLLGECDAFYFTLVKTSLQLLSSMAREAVEDLTGGVTSEIMARDILDKERFWNEDLMNVNKKFVFGCATGLYGSWLYPQYYGSKERSGIHECHAYSVMDAKEINGKRLLRLRYVIMSFSGNLPNAELNYPTEILGVIRNGQGPGAMALNNGHLNG